MDQRRFFIAAGIGCVALLFLLVVAVPLAFLNFFPIRRTVIQADTPAIRAETPARAFEATQQAIPTLTPAGPAGTPSEPQDLPDISSALLAELYRQANPGVVSLAVSVERGGRTGAVSGSGFILDEQGHIVTNNHVVAGGELLVVIFYDGTQSRAEIVGTDVDSDLAVVRVDELPENTHALPLGDSELVEPGQWVVAIGNPFALSSTMTTGIVSAVGRAIPSEAVGFSIPQSIQTDAAINPGNSGGPLLNMAGEVIGVNAQIATGGQVMANAGVGFAIPANIVRRVVPVLIEEGSFRWPWLGVVGPPGGVDLFIKEANNLETQAGAYIHQVVEGGPADEAGLQGTEEIVEVDGIEVPIGGDVVIEANGERIDDFNDLLVQVAFASPGDRMDLAVIRDGQQRTVSVELGARPENFHQTSSRCHDLLKGGFMGRDREPKHKRSRREGRDLYGTGGESLQRRLQTPPGMHGRKPRPRQSEYARQLREKQKVKRNYGIRERQFRRFMMLAQRTHEQSGRKLTRISTRG